MFVPFVLLQKKKLSNFVYCFSLCSGVEGGRGSGDAREKFTSSLGKIYGLVGWGAPLITYKVRGENCVNMDKSYQTGPYPTNKF